MPGERFRHIKVHIVGQLPQFDVFRYLLTLTDRFIRITLSGANNKLINTDSSNLHYFANCQSSSALDTFKRRPVICQKVKVVLICHTNSWIDDTIIPPFHPPLDGPYQALDRSPKVWKLLIKKNSKPFSSTVWSQHSKLCQAIRLLQRRRIHHHLKHNFQRH